MIKSTSSSNCTNWANQNEAQYKRACAPIYKTTVEHLTCRACLQLNRHLSSVTQRLVFALPYVELEFGGVCLDLFR